MRAWEVQEAVFAKLTGSAELMAIATGVYDHVPSNAVFPYVVVGEDLSLPADTDDDENTDHSVVLHAWSRYRGLKETKQIQQAIYSAIHRKPLAVADAVYIDGSIESQETFLDDDGLTRHGVQRFRLLVDEVTQ